MGKKTCDVVGLNVKRFTFYCFTALTWLCNLRIRKENNKSLKFVLKNVHLAITCCADVLI